jgi:hypothetical protein
VSVVVAEPQVASERWLVSRRFDLLWFFGGTGLALLLPALLWVGVSMAAIFWSWTLLVDGPHIGATLIRTYIDKEEWRTRGPVLRWSLLVFAVGPLFLLANVVSGSHEPFRLFLGFSALYGVYHVVRQHYGFMALYRAVRKDDPTSMRADGWSLYVGCWAPYLYFSATHPLSRRLFELPAEAGVAAQALGGACVVAYVLAVVAFAVRTARAPRRNAPKAGYVLSTLALYGLVFFGVARFEPVHPAPRTPDEGFMLIGIMIALAHGLQYLALVWVHNRNRYAEEGVDYGPARGVNGSLLRYALALVLFSATLYVGTAVLTGVFPWFHPYDGVPLAGSITVSEAALALWWGLALHHYVVDAKIWRVRGDGTLKRHLGLT